MKGLYLVALSCGHQFGSDDNILAAVITCPTCKVLQGVIGNKYMPVATMNAITQYDSPLDKRRMAIAARLAEIKRLQVELDRLIAEDEAQTRP